MKTKKKIVVKKHKIKKIVFDDEEFAFLTVINDNQKQVYKVKADNCLIVNREIKKCDWITCLENNNKVILIELKSKDLRKNKYKKICSQFLGTTKTMRLKKILFISSHFL